jgi:hypothetical protein
VCSALGTSPGRYLGRERGIIASAPDRKTARSLADAGVVAADAAAQWDALDAAAPAVPATDHAGAFVAIALADPCLVIAPTGCGIPNASTIAERDDLVIILCALTDLASQAGSPAAVTVDDVVAELTRRDMLDAAGGAFAIHHAARYARPEHLGVHFDVLAAEVTT